MEQLGARRGAVGAWGLGPPHSSRRVKKLNNGLHFLKTRKWNAACAPPVALRVAQLLWCGGDPAASDLLAALVSTLQHPVQSAGRVGRRSGRALRPERGPRRIFLTVPSRRCRSPSAEVRGQAPCGIPQGMVLAGGWVGLRPKVVPRAAAGCRPRERGVIGVCEGPVCGPVIACALTPGC